MTDAEKERLVALTNHLSLATTAQLVAETNRLIPEFGPINAVTVTVDAALSAAVAVLQSAVLVGAIEPTISTEESLRRRLDHILALRSRLHFRQPDGSIDPAGVALN
ncbi:MAG: hypothetical protein GY873_08615 [Bosea sp.]|uniref:hypothetical protein n=1 Tax=Bosea sp. (in: a-proteobacteria) TaxID=1871050 RepID=UPI00239C0C6C|nr:hypothetical protein [Bosea sp. (in: a-proteobacteria)]MCP4734241.1 hypothetical protein [Bosea sp. (in: a-proteobacteria)]